MRLISGVIVLAGLVAAPFANAQVFKCTEADGKTVYSQAPCTKADNKEKLVKLNDSPMTDTPPASSGNAAYGASGPGTPSGTGNASRNDQNQGRSVEFPRKVPQKPGYTPPPSNQQLIAECEANHGARCSSAAEINYRRQLQRTPSPQEQSSIQAAIQARRKREENELRNRYGR